MTSAVDTRGVPARAAARVQRRPAAAQPRAGRGRSVRVVAGLILPALVLAVWWIGTDQGWLNTRIYSSPRLIAIAAAELWQQGLLQQHILVSLQRAGIGFAIGAVIGIGLGTLSGFFRPVEILIDPSVQLFRAVPLTIVLPLFIVWFGFGELPRLLLIILVIVPNLYIDTYSGIRNTDKKLLEVARVFAVTKREEVFGIVIPAALPFIFNGLRKASITAFIMLIFAETLNASSGLGYLAAQAMQFVRMDVLFLVVFLYAILGIGADALVRLAEKIATPWRGAKGVR